MVCFSFCTIFIVHYAYSATKLLLFFELTKFFYQTKWIATFKWQKFTTLCTSKTTYGYWFIPTRLTRLTRRTRERKDGQSHTERWRYKTGGAIQKEKERDNDRFFIVFYKILINRVFNNTKVSLLHSILVLQLLHLLA